MQSYAGFNNLSHDYAYKARYLNEIELYLKLCLHVYLQKLAVLNYFRSLFSLARRASSWSAVILFFGDSDSIETVS